MNRGGIGSASIVLVFVVLCLAIFTVISLVPAMTEQTLIERELQLVEAFYIADTFAEKILAEILTADEILSNIMGVAIDVDWDFDYMAQRVSFMSPVSENRDIYVSLIVGDGFYEILSWRMHDSSEWESDDLLNVFQGFWD